MNITFHRLSFHRLLAVHFSFLSYRRSFTIHFVQVRDYLLLIPSCVLLLLDICSNMLKMGKSKWMGSAWTWHYSTPSLKHSRVECSTHWMWVYGEKECMNCNLTISFSPAAPRRLRCTLHQRDDDDEFSVSHMLMQIIYICIVWIYWNEIIDFAALWEVCLSDMGSN